MRVLGIHVGAVINQQTHCSRVPRLRTVAVFRAQCSAVVLSASRLLAAPNPALSSAAIPRMSCLSAARTSGLSLPDCTAPNPWPREPEDRANAPLSCKSALLPSFPSRWTRREQPGIEAPIVRPAAQDTSLSCWGEVLLVPVSACLFPREFGRNLRRTHPGCACLPTRAGPAQLLHGQVRPNLPRSASGRPRPKVDPPRRAKWTAPTSERRSRLNPDQSGNGVPRWRRPGGPIRPRYV